MTPAEVVQQLFQCRDDDLGNAVLKTSPAAVEDTEDILNKISRVKRTTFSVTGENLKVFHSVEYYLNAL